MGVRGSSDSGEVDLTDADMHRLHYGPRMCRTGPQGSLGLPIRGNVLRHVAGADSNALMHAQVRVDPGHANDRAVHLLDDGAGGKGRKR